ncbi:Dps family protein [Arenicella xantha]|uniref:Starvation-inducible DNA-binding protein n=1 Tax=Arenicella xantha TaxID=644221 RepID=A0A395JLR1_9GAMM|nr:DNA starvation/stationary phase protection protein [Arenicella xantha]RBP48720.1 starvation-inducible DNA-binding protein [Arenicella xantha]
MNSEVLDINSKEMTNHTGIERDQRLELSKELGLVLANSYALYAETQGVHWNIVGPTFYSVHKLTEAQYEDLAISIDDIAERIRALGFKAPAGLGAMRDLAYINSDIDYTNARKMLEALIEDNETLSRKMRDVIKIAEQCDDVKTADLLTDRIGQLEENAWMLRAVAAE